MKLPYGLFMAEAEGYLDTRESKIQRVIKTVRQYQDPVVPTLVFYTICKDCGIEPSSLTEAELRRIKNAIKR